MKVDVILGLQWGDEGKAKLLMLWHHNMMLLLDFRAAQMRVTIIFGEQKYVLHTVLSGIFRKHSKYIGNGVVIDPFIFFKEIDAVIGAGFDPYLNLIISRNAHLIMPTHRLLDAVNEAAIWGKIGSTLKGIGPTYTDKYKRTGLRVGELENNSFQKKYQSRKRNT